MKSDRAIDYRSKGENFKIIYYLKLGLSTFIFNIINFVTLFLRRIIYKHNNYNIKKLIILGFGGIGNHIKITPMLRALKENNPDLIIYFVTYSKICYELFEKDPYINQILFLKPASKYKIVRSLKIGKKIKNLMPDALLVASGTDPVEGSMISFFSKAYIKIGEDWKGRGFFYTHKIKANAMRPEIEQNLDLANFIGISKKYKYPSIYLTNSEKTTAMKWKENLNISSNSKLIGIHPGSGREQKWKRWPIENYLELAKTVYEMDKNIVILFFLGNDEVDLIEEVNKIVKDRIHIVKEQKSIRMVAGKISQCDIFLSNDSGLVYIAQALGVKTITIFGPTSIKKNHVFGNNNHIIFKKNILCRPCHYKKWFLACNNQRPCLKLITVDEIISTLNNMLK